MNRPRLFTIGLLAAALVAIPAIASAATLSITGTTSGSAIVEAPTADAACNPTAPVDPADYICDFDLAGTFDMTELGTGTYTGSTRLDWSIYTGPEPCAELTGTMVLTNAEGSITVEMLDTSRVCETDDPGEHTSSMDATVVSGTGAYLGATGTFTGDGTLFATETAGEYDAAQDLVGSVTVPDPTPNPTPTPAPTASAAPSASVPAAASDSPAASPTATPVVGQLPDTAGPSSGATLPAVLVLAGLVAAFAVRGLSSRTRS